VWNTFRSGFPERRIAVVYPSAQFSKQDLFWQAKAAQEYLLILQADFVRTDNDNAAEVYTGICDWDPIVGKDGKSPIQLADLLGSHEAPTWGQIEVVPQEFPVLCFSAEDFFITSKGDNHGNYRLFGTKRPALRR
jgi:hypothetical protein